MMGKVLIQDIANKLTVQNGLGKKEATLFVNIMFDVIREALERDKMVKVKGLGTFKIIDVDSRESVNVNTGERVLIEGHNKITFTPDVLMKELVNKPFSQFETVVLNDGVDFKNASMEEAVLEHTEEPVTEEDSEIPLVDFVSEEVSDEVSGESTLGKVVESIVTSIEEKPIESEKNIEPEPTYGPETLVETKPIVEPEVTAEPETQTEENSDIDGFADIKYEEQHTSKSWLVWLLVCLFSLGIGYMLGNFFPFQCQTESKDTVKPQVEETVPPKPADLSVQPVAESVMDDLKETKTEQTPVKQVSVEQAPIEEKYDRYEAMDSRVRTGAYRIIGTDYVEKVKEGDNLKRIAKRTLGPDMECYIEVFNDLNASTELKVGQKINIPKLILKKKKQQKN